MNNTKVTLKQWENFSTEISVSKQTVEQLSKLYIIIHERVKSTIKNSVINPNVSFSVQIQHHIEFIKNILEKIRKTQNDQYLVDIEKDLLRKYEKSLLGLMNQIQIMLKVQESKLNLTTDKLKALKQQKRQKYDLRNEIVQSGKRIVRAKSGYKIKTNHNQNKQQQQNLMNKMQNDQGSFFPTIIQVQSKSKPKTFKISNQIDFQAAFQSKREKLAQTMRKSMSPSKNGLGVSFQNKYQQNYLQMYFQERKQFADLIFNQEVYNQIILNNHLQTDTPQTKIMDSNFKSLKGMKVDDINNKLFPQFQIKTKFLKPVVKSKISNLITDIKKELMKQYFLDNIQTIKSINEKQMPNLQTKKSTNLLIKNRSQSLSNIPIQKSKYSKNTIKGKKMQEYNKKFGKTQYITKKQPESLVKIHRSNSFSELNKQDFNLIRSKKSFINTNSKPFYQTSNWNQEIQKKYQNKVMSKLLKAKLP